MFKYIGKKMEEGLVMNQDMYKRPIYDSNYHIKNFFLSYKGLVNLSRMKDYPDDYMRQLNEIQLLTKDVNFNKNTLFICDKDIARELFLVGFSRLKDIKSYFYCNMVELFDVWWGNRKSTNMNVPEDEVMFSDQDIMQDVMCVYVSPDLFMSRGSKVVNSSIESRVAKTGKNGQNLLNWVFFCGTEDELRGSDFFIIRKMFENKQGFQIVSLNGGSISAVGSSVVGRKGKMELEDIY